MLINEWVWLRSQGLLIKSESALRFSFGVRAQTEIKIWRIKGMCTVFLWSDMVATIFSAACIVQLLFKSGYLFEGSIYFFKKCRIRYVWAVQWQLLYTVSSTCNLSVLLPALERSCTTQTALVLACWQIICVRVPHTLAAATIGGRCLFSSELLIVRLSEGDYNSRAVSIEWNLVCLKQEFITVKGQLPYGFYTHIRIGWRRQSAVNVLIRYLTWSQFRC